MEKMQKDWQLYTKKILLNVLYDENRDEKVTNFLKEYSLSKFSASSKESYDFKMEILFGRNDEKVKIIAECEPEDWRFYWTIPNGFDITILGKILDRFEFQNYVEW